MRIVVLLLEALGQDSGKDLALAVLFLPRLAEWLGLHWLAF